MTDANATAHPCIESINHGDLVEITTSEAGLTKREYFAAMAMQGLCASGFYTNKKFQSTCEDIGSNITEALVVAATDIADGLIAELNKGK